VAEDVREARVALDEVEDGGDETHFVARGTLVSWTSVGASSWSGYEAILKLFGVITVTAAAMGEADVSVSIPATLFVNFADGGVCARFSGYLSTT